MSGSPIQPNNEHDSDSYPLIPRGVELTVYLDKNTQNGPLVITWDIEEIEGRKYYLIGLEIFRSHSFKF